MTAPQPDRDVNMDAAKTRDPGSTVWSTAPPKEEVLLASVSAARRVGPYVLEALLGSGSFGDVWLATREGELAHTRLAVKLPHSSRVDLAAIRQEATLWARVGGHPSILPIFEATVYDGQVVIASEYAPDGSLAEWLKRHGGRAPSLDDAAQITLGVLSGLEHLHGLGVIHRDIKPANVLLQSGIPRLADFGLSRALRASPSGVPAGTPAFMAPEAWDGVRSIQTDIWSVGVMFYELLTGSLPFPERELSPLLKSILTRDPAPLPPDIQSRYGDVLSECLAKDPSRRFGTASLMAATIVERLGRSIDSVRLLAHTAVFWGSTQFALFVNATNLSETVDREVTHVWIETNPKIYIENGRRPLPKRLKPQETWETWIELWRLPDHILNEKLPTLVRARLSTGEVLCGIHNQLVPESGWVPGEPPIQAGQFLGTAAYRSPQRAVVEKIDPDIVATHDLPARKKRPWWKFW